MNKTNIYYAIDALKLICAILILAMHTYNRDFGDTGSWFMSTICNIGVPFFFIASGFFYTKGLLRNSNPLKDESTPYFKKYFKRISTMYVVWTVMTLPVAYIIIEAAHGDYPTYLKFIYLIRLFVFTGSIGIYWYILALIYNSAIIYFVHKKNADKWLYIIATIFWIIGTLYTPSYSDGNLLFKTIHIVFGSERNFLNVGLFYMAIGYYFAKHPIKSNSLFLFLLFLISIALRSLEIEYHKTNMLQALEAVMLFMLGINLRWDWLAKSSIHLRKLSTAIYLQHSPFILLFDFYLKRGTIVDFCATLTFCLATYYFLMKLLPKRATDILYGN